MASTTKQFVMLLVVILSLTTAFAARKLTEDLQVPDALRVPTGYKQHLLLNAKGVQYYRYNGTNWVNYSAKAKLRDPESKKVMARHYYLAQPDPLGGQPTWETLPSKGVPWSLVTGAAAETATVNADSITWVLLKATNNAGDKKYFGDVEYIQRINTTNGLAPSSTSGAQEGDVQTSDYTADYAFYIPCS